MAMDAELKAKWIDALRSGKFVQGKGMLKCHENGVDKHCCLGVLWEIAGRKFERLAPGSIGYAPEADPTDTGGAYQMMEKMINPEWDEETSIRQCYLFWGMNDAAGKTFAEIADYAEEHC